MIDFQQVLLSCGSNRIKTLSSKADSKVFLMERPDGSCFILRAYCHEIEVYRTLTGHTCSSLPQVYRTYSRDGIFCVEEEYIDGVSLQVMISGGAHFDEERTRSLTRKICSAAAYLHSRGFIHRDVKPEHVLLTPDGRVLLIDLDAAMSIARQKCSDTQLLGTAIYAAPEQFGLTRSDERSDIYAMGILMNELLTGQHPAITRYRGGSMAAVIERCIQMNPADRYQTVTELDEVLNEISFSAADNHGSGGKKIRSVRNQAGMGIAAALVIAAVFLPAMGRENPPALPQEQLTEIDVMQNEDSGPIMEPEQESEPDAETKPESDKEPEAEPQKQDTIQQTTPTPKPEKSKPQKEDVLSDKKTDDSEKTAEEVDSDDGAARVPGTDYLQLYKEGRRETIYFNYRAGSQSASLFTEDGTRVDETWTVYADSAIGRIEGWDDYYQGWCLRSEGCDMGATGYLHGEKDGKHYAIQVAVRGEPMSAYTSIPSLGNYTAGYLQPRVYPELRATPLVKVEYRRNEPLNLYLVAMDGFRDLQPSCTSSMVRIDPCGDALAWDEPVFNMTFFNPDGGDALIEVTSNHTFLQFYFYEAL